MSGIAFALIKRLVAIGQIDADDIAAICEELGDSDAMAVQAAWIEGLAGDDNKDFAPTLRVIDGGQRNKAALSLSSLKTPDNSDDLRD